MGKLRLRLFHWIFSFIATCIGTVSFAQCNQLFDFYGSPSSNPYWYSCTGFDYSFNLQSPNNWSSYSIDWGDGSAPTVGTNWNSPQIINHLYAAAVDTFIVVVTDLTNGCQVQGVVVMEQATSASIQIPVGGLTQACAPQVMDFINSSTNVSQTTVFTWDFGDGTEPLVFDHTNWLQTISHLYDVGTVDCETIVRLTAQNYCNIVQGGNSTATFNPIRIWDIDDASISATATLLCYPDTTVTFTNSTERNCFFQGNIYQRYEYWNLGDYWGLGHDSIIDWTPWPPTFPHTIHFPGVGSYTISMLDSNFCGIAPASITIQIVSPPVADIAASNDTICLGSPVTFYQNATGGANSYSWNFGDGSGWLPTSSGNITIMYDAPGTYLVQSRVAVTGSSSNCSDIDSVWVVVLPIPDVGIVADNNNACDSMTVNFTANTTNAVTWDWTFDVAPFTFTGQYPPTIAYNAPGNYQVSLAVTSPNGCSANDNHTVHVRQSPVADFTYVNLCEGDTATFLDASTSDDSVVNWSWTFGDGSQSTLQNPEHFFNSNGSYAVGLSIQTNYCSDTVTKVIEIAPAAIAVANADVVSGCSPLQVTFTSSSISAASLLWQFGDGTISQDSLAQHSFFNTGNTDTTYFIVLTAMSAFNCGTSDTVAITVHPGAIAAFTDNNSLPGCSPFDAQFTNESQNAISYLWNLGDGTTSVQTNPTHQYINSTGFLATYNVSLVAYSPNGCNDTVSHPVIVYPLAVMNIDLAINSGCSPLLVTMPYIPGIINYNWSFGDGATSTFPIATHQYVNNSGNTQNFTVTLIGTNAFGCTDTASTTVQVFPSPIAQFTPSVDAGCSPLEVSFVNLIFGTTQSEWSFGNNTDTIINDINFTRTFTNSNSIPSNISITLQTVNSFGCQASYTDQITVYPGVTASFNAPSNVCAPAAVIFENTSLNADGFTWDFGNGIQSNETNPSTIFNLVNQTNQVLNVGLLAFNNYGCQDMVQQPLTVNTKPQAIFTINENIACAPAPLEITNLSVGGTSFAWDYGDGTVSNNADIVHIHQFNSIGNNAAGFTIHLTVTNDAGCADTISQVFNLYPSVTAAFTGSPGGCSPYQASFVNQSIGAVAYEWQFGDTGISGETSPIHTYTTSNVNDQNFFVRLIAINEYGCQDTATSNVPVYHQPLALAYIDSLYGCYPRNVLFHNASLGADSFQWVYGTGATSDTTAQYHNYTYYNLGNTLITYDVTLVATTNQGCQSTDHLSVDVAPQLQAAFDVNNQGCTPLHVYFNNNSDGAFSYFWDFGDGDISNLAEPDHVFFNYSDSDTAYNVLLIIQNNYGCRDTADAIIQVLASPVASFIASPVYQVWPSNSVAIANNTTGGQLSYEWTMGDGTYLYNSDLTSYAYGTWGDYTIRLIVSNGFCSDTAFQQVTIVAPPPIADFSGPAEGCAPLTVNFTNNSLFAQYSVWQFGDGGQANATDPIYTYWNPGTYTVTLTVGGYDGSTDVMVQEQIIHVYPRAYAAFVVTPAQVNIPSQPVYCQNMSQNATIFEWSFGDGNTSNLENPLHYYGAEGRYDVTLIANNAFNCPDTMLVVGAVQAKAGGMIDFPNAFTPNIYTASGGAYDPYSYDNDVFFPKHQGVTEYQLQIFNKWGELLYESKDVYKGWDGYYRGEVCKQDVYVWKVKAKFVDGQTYQKAGDVTLLIK